ncbi:MAG TPA: riboflavin synthase [Desulfuromonadales bacterium]|nr:riboflavin synthase [Desulfuromonadales bacterium]
MFTGLIQDIGIVKKLHKGSEMCQLTVATALPMVELTRGESIAVNGACLTVVAFGDGIFTADVSPETLTRTTLGELAPGDSVNLERALRLCDRLGGHLVSGHIDGVGTVTARRREANAVLFALRVAPELARFIVEKGSVAVDGISLTVNAVDAEAFTLTVIPETLVATTLNDRQPGARVNIETDLIGKYVDRLLHPASAPAGHAAVDLDFLAKHGFL